MGFVWSYDSPLGGITLGSDGDALTGLWFDGQKFCCEGIGPDPVKRRLSVFEESCRWLDRYFEGKEPGFTPPIALQGTPFRLTVWEILRSIPYGQTMSYGQIASTLAAHLGIRSMSAQAVGGAVGHNPISLIIPCHRVLGADGSLTGYAGGVERKTSLLRLEKIL
ncbi:MAG: methylated-DNA--[Bacteroidales bacterium]|nr:methylated-DNA--[protein]-cysteine S-methyltransferase [Bacteroidales bacterium]